MPRFSMLMFSSLLSGNQVQGFNFKECLLTNPTSLSFNFKTNLIPKLKGISRYPCNRWLRREL